MQTKTLTQAQTDIFVKYLDKICEMADDAEAEWVVKLAHPMLDPMLAQYVSSGGQPLTVNEEQVIVVGVLAQDVVSYRAGPQSPDEIVFFDILNMFEKEEEYQDFFG